MRHRPSTGPRARRILTLGRRRRPSLEDLEPRIVLAQGPAPSLAGYVNVTFPENTVNATPQLLDTTGITVSDAQGDWAGGTLAVSGLLAEDRVGILTAGNVARVGNDVRVDGTTIGTVGSGAGQTGLGESLVVTFNDSATNAAVQAVVRALTYQDVSDAPTETRRLTVLLTDAASNRSTPEQVAANFTRRIGPADPFPTSGLGIHVDPTLGDVDGDGDLDLLIGFDNGLLSFYRNVGTATAPEYVPDIVNPFAGIVAPGSASPALFDFDSDGDLDLALGNGSGSVAYYLNAGTAAAPEYLQQLGASNPFSEITVPAYSRLAPGDVDGDGKVDLLVGGSVSTLDYYRNVGTSGSPAYALQTGIADPFASIIPSFYNTPTLGDVDGDGDLDLLIGRNDGNFDFFRNVGTASVPIFVQELGPTDPFDGIVTVGDAHPKLVDLDGDNLPEALIGDLVGNLYLYGRDRFSLEVTITPEAEIPPVLIGGTIPMVARVGGPAVAVDPNLVILNPSGANLTTASVAIGANFTPAEDRLLFDGQNGITGSYNASTGILTLTGSATAAQYQAALRSVRYQDINDNTATANRAPRSISFSIAPGTFNPANGHYYEFVAAPEISWTDARAAALARSLFGLRGYLATITSDEENTFAFSKAQATGWIGGSDADEEGVWRWVDGPEEGDQFWQGGINGSAVDGAFVAWNGNQPDNAGNAEHYLQFVSNGLWNDLPNGFSLQGYVVEYGGSKGDPVLSLTSLATVAVVVITDAPTVSVPATPTLVNTPNVTIQGTAEAGSLVKIYRDANNNGVLDEGEAVVGSRQLAEGQTNYSILVGLVPDAANDFLVTATLGEDEESDPLDVPTVTSDATAPAPPTVSSPTAPVALNAANATIAGTAEAGSLVRIYDDANGNGVLDEGEAVVGSRQLAEGQTTYSILVPLAPGAANHFLATATDAVGNRSAPAVVPTIIQDATAPPVPTVTGPSAPSSTIETTFAVTGTAEAGSLVRIYRDSNGDGAIGEGDEVVGLLQLGPGQTSYSITVPLVAGAINRFLVTSTDAAGNESGPAAVPTIEITPPMAVGTSSLGGVIFDDINGNGVQEPGEAGLANVTVTLEGTDADGNPVRLAVVTAADGSYIFPDLRSGVYSLILPGADGASGVAGTLGGRGQGGRIDGIVLGDGAAGVGYSFAARAVAPPPVGPEPLPTTGRLAGFVYLDRNRNGVYNAGRDVGIATIRVILTGVDDRGMTVRIVTTTDATGAYVFEGLRPGTYKIRDVPTRYFRNTRPVARASRAASLDARVAEIAVAAGSAAEVSLGKLPVAGCRLIPLMGPGGINRPIPRGPLLSRFFPTLTSARAAGAATRKHAVPSSADGGAARQEPR